MFTHINKRGFTAIMACLMLVGSATFVSIPEAFAAGTVSKSISMVVKTKTSSELFWIKDGTRHPFPNSSIGAKIYKSWFGDFSNVKVISDARMQWIEIGKSVSPKPGTMLLKFEPGDKKVYEVVGENKISEIETVQEAIDKYGAKWASSVYDLPSIYLTDYEIE